VLSLFQGDSVVVTFVGANPRNDRKVCRICYISHNGTKSSVIL